MTTQSRPHRGKLRGLATALFALTLGGSLSASAEPVATGARLGEHPGDTRFVLDLTESVDFRVFTLADPDRIVVELPEIDWRLPAKTGDEGAGLVKSYRFGPFGNHRSRVVLDLAAPAKIRSQFVMPAEDGKPARLVLDLVATSAATFEASAGWPDEHAGEATPPQEQPADVPAQNHDGQLIIALDPGHGGVDPGASGVSGTYEKDVTLAIAKSLKAELEKRPGYKIIMTREDDTFITLKDRVKFARAGHADLMISIHADSESAGGAHGASIYTLSETASDKTAAELAKSENAADVISGVDLSGETDTVTDILIDLAQRETKNRSVVFTDLALPEMAKEIDLLPKPHRFAGFRVLKAPDVPSVLIETGFLSSHADETELTSAIWQNGMARAIAKAVDQYFDRMQGVVDSSPGGGGETEISGLPGQAVRRR